MRHNNLPAERREPRGMTAFDMLQDRIDHMFEDFAQGFSLPRGLGSGNGDMLPSIDMHEKDGKVMISAELPGVEEKDIEISVDEGMLTISGEKRSEVEDKSDGTYRTERSFGRFSRSIRLPFDVDPQKVDARFVNGVLKLTIERPAEAEPRIKKIAIQH
ncbi:Hsp20/alpha crystallin family protein [Devosia sp. ZB163]|uniref:Hsp20/alpha crystallin family protein n=1 Tax=Devosia sp. ZB163 TaxID=3025938 RepID=UPI00235DD7DB|nr:Hsp20/alpha crystallin family protein [Devosia sp. ZB163]MDC9824065.1 Hsp20/alpha crystallin family protein [Devosia sp. ZB163]